MTGGAVPIIFPGLTEGLSEMDAQYGMNWLEIRCAT